MKSFGILFVLLFLLPACGMHYLHAQQSASTGSVLTPEHQYEEYITGALRLQVKADSLSRAANLKRRELAFAGDASDRKEKEGQILLLENESYRLQRQADSLYSQARAAELRIMAARNEAGAGGINSGVHVSPSEASSTCNIQGQASPSFLVLGDQDISKALTRSELSGALEIEPDYERAALIMENVSDLSDEIEQLGYLLDANPPRRERRRISRRMDDLGGEVFKLKMEAMQIYEKANAIRYSAATRFLEDRRKDISDSLIIRSGLVHEGNAKDSFTQAGGLRKSAHEMRSDKYLEGFILRAYNEEMKAFTELETALEIYNTPSVPVGSVVRGTPLREDGRLDPGLALARSRTQRTQTPEQTGPQMDFGFSVLSATPYSAQNPIPANVVLPKGMVFTVQLGIFNTVMTPGSFGGLYPVMAEREASNEPVRYYTGVFRTIAEAERALVDVNRQGFSDAFIIAYNDGIRMPVNRARQMERNTQQTAAGLQQSTVPSVPSSPGTGTPVMEKATIVTYRIQLGAFSKPVDQDVFRRWHGLAGGKNIDYDINNRGLYVYSTGNFNTFEETVKIRGLFRENGVPDAFIVPYRGDLRISIEEANQLLRNQ